MIRHRAHTSWRGTLRDPDELFRALEGSRFRASFALGGAERHYLEARGMAVVLEHAARFVRQRLAPARPARDGKQTPYGSHPAFVAQHATATCCRGCLARWHRIEKGRPLTDAEQAYVVQVIGRWLRAAVGVPREADAPP